MNERENTHRRALDAASRFSRIASLLGWQAEHARSESERWLTGYEAERLLAKVLSEAAPLVWALNDDEDAEDALRDARALYESLRARQLARKLENTAGRTAEETATFQEKAQALRNRT